MSNKTWVEAQHMQPMAFCEAGGVVVMVMDVPTKRPENPGFLVPVYERRGSSGSFTAVQEDSKVHPRPDIDAQFKALFEADGAQGELF